MAVSHFVFYPCGALIHVFTNPSLWLAVILYDRPTPQGLSKPSPEQILHVTASDITIFIMTSVLPLVSIINPFKDILLHFLEDPLLPALH